MADAPHVHLLATGGTIANPPDVDGYLSGEQLVAAVPEVSDVADVTAEDVASLGSQALTPRHLFSLAERITSLAESDESPDGVVVTSGSNANEEIAYFLHLTLNTELPVVTTAAQRNHGTVGNDGDRNLVDAVRVASHHDARGRGVLSVFNDEIHSAREVTKTVSSRPDAWSSGDLGDLGFVDKHGRVQFYRQSERRHTTDTPFDVAGYDADAMRDVHVVYSSIGDDGTMVDAAVRAGADGIVLAGFPTGAPAEPVDYRGQDEAIAEAAREIPVMYSHRGSNGWTYAYIDEKYDTPVIGGEDLSPQKARILLYLALQEAADRERIQQFFLDY